MENISARITRNSLFDGPDAKPEYSYGRAANIYFIFVLIAGEGNVILSSFFICHFFVNAVCLSMFESCAMIPPPQLLDWFKSTLFTVNTVIKSTESNVCLTTLASK